MRVAAAAERVSPAARPPVAGPPVLPGPAPADVVLDLSAAKDQGMKHGEGRGSHDHADESHLSLVPPPPVQLPGGAPPYRPRHSGDEPITILTGPAAMPRRKPASAADERTSPTP